MAIPIIRISALVFVLFRCLPLQADDNIVSSDPTRKFWDSSAIVQEIQGTLGAADACVLVVDVSPSMAGVLADLGRDLASVRSILKESGRDYIPLGLVTYSDKARVVVKPVKNHGKVAEALASLKPSSSGQEKPFTAIRLALTELSPQTQRLVLFLFYDEAGDDQQELESVLTLCRQKNAVVHLVGRDAAFGRSRWQWQEAVPGRPVELLEARLGSEMPQDRIIYETRFLQRIWDPMGRGLEFCISSGYSPWALSRLARETSGIYFALKGGSSRLIHGMDHAQELKADYRPPLELIDTVETTLATHLLGKSTSEALSQTAVMSWPNLQFKGVKNEKDVEFRLNKCLKETQAASLRVEAILAKLLEGRHAYREGHLRIRADWELAVASLATIRFHLARLEEQLKEWLEDPMALKNTGQVIIIPKFGAAEMGLRPTQESHGVDLLGKADSKGDMTDRFLADIHHLATVPCLDTPSLRKRAERALDLVSGNHAGTPWSELARRIKTVMGDYELRSIRLPPSGPGNESIHQGSQ